MRLGTGRLGVVITSLVLLAGCGWRHGPPEGSPGHVSEANEACATLFYSDEEQPKSDGLCAPSCMCGRYSFSEPLYDEHDIQALRSYRLETFPTERAARAAGAQVRRKGTRSTSTSSTISST